MNEAFRQYAFGRVFNIQLSERHISYLARFVKGDNLAEYGLDSAKHGLLRRGLIETYYSTEHHQMRFRVTRAGILVYDLLIEAGEMAVLDETRRKTLDMEAEISRLEWDERHDKIEIKFKDRFLRETKKAGE